MLVLSFFDPRFDLRVTTIGVHHLPREEEIYTHVSESLQKANGNLVTLDIGLPDGQRLRLPNVYFAALTETKDQIIIPPPPPPS